MLHSTVSRTTLLRLPMAIPDPSWEMPKVLGVDDFATRRRQHYGTVLIDCETRKPLGLLYAAALSSFSLLVTETGGRMPAV